MITSCSRLSKNRMVCWGHWQVSILPFDVLGIVFNSDGVSQMKAFRVVRLLRLLKLVRVFKASKYADGSASGRGLPSVLVEAR